MRSSLPVIQDETGSPIPGSERWRKPSWLKIRPPDGPLYLEMKQRARRLKLATVCEEAQCPNLAECWGGGTATFMLMGDTCTRGCRFCAVSTAKAPPPLDPSEPDHIAEAVAEMGLTYVVLTSVNRDDVPDGGAAHLAACIRAIKARAPAVMLEVLIPDFLGQFDSIRLLAESPIEVIAHNLETTERLTAAVRDPRAHYDQSLAVLEYAKGVSPRLLTKSSLMLGLGESEAEVIQSLSDLRSRGVDVVTLGQYLRPSPRHLPVAEYIHPNTFDRLASRARAMGFGYVAAGPLVRSSYRAGELYIERTLRAKISDIITPPPETRA